MARKRLSPVVFSGCLAAMGILVWGCGARTGLEAGSAVACAHDMQCDDGNPCTTDTCVLGDAGTGHCDYQPAPVGTPCDDGSSCTSGDACAADGACIGTTNGTCLPPPVDTTCPAGCASGTPDFPAAVPLVPPGLSASCSSGFEMNTPPQQIFTVESTSPGGAAATTLDIEIATYKAPDHLSMTAVDATGTVYALVNTCHLQTATYGDPTNGCVRPPDDSIRQYQVNIKAGTRSVSFDMTGACTPTYVRVLGLCDFDVTPFFTGCGFRSIP